MGMEVSRPLFHPGFSRFISIGGKVFSLEEILRDCLALRKILRDTFHCT